MSIEVTSIEYAMYFVELFTIQALESENGLELRKLFAFVCVLVLLMGRTLCVFVCGCVVVSEERIFELGSDISSNV